MPGGGGALRVARVCRNSGGAVAVRWRCGGGAEAVRWRCGSGAVAVRWRVRAFPAPNPARLLSTGMGVERLRQE